MDEKLTDTHVEVIPTSFEHAGSIPAVSNVRNSW